MLKTSKPSKRSKTNSSYLISGMNIVKMVTQEQCALPAEPSEASLSKVSKAPIMKYPIKQKDANYDVLNLPNKSFKIRSFTKKIKESSHIKEDDSCEIFQKMDCVRNLRAINSRIEAFNLSRLSAQERANRQNASRSITANIYSKMKQIFKRDSSMKCKVGSQIVVKETLDKGEYVPLPLEYEVVNTEPFREIANKCQIYYHESHLQNDDKSTLLILSLESLKVNSKRITKCPEETKFFKCSSLPQQTIQIIKMATSQQFQKTCKICFKVSDSTAMEQLRNILEQHQLKYHCIFCPLGKQCEPWNLYNIDSLLYNCQQVVLLDNIHNFSCELPILNYVPTIMVGTSHENFLTLSRIMLALQSFFTPLPSQKESIHQEEAEQVQQQNYRSSKMCIVSCDFKAPKQDNKIIEKPKKTHNFNLKQDKITLNVFHMQSYIEMLQTNRLIKAKKQKRPNHKHRGEPQIKRIVLGEKSTNIPDQPLNTSSQKFEKSNLKSMQQIGEELMDHAKQILPEYWKTPNITARHNESTLKYEDLEQIMSSLRGNSLQAKPIFQQVTDLIRKNANIYKQISQYVTSNKQVALPESTSNITKMPDIQLKIYRIT